MKKKILDLLKKENINVEKFAYFLKNIYKKTPITGEN